MKTMLISSLFIAIIISPVFAFEFFDIRPPDSSTTADFQNSSIAWRPQGDYALLVSTRIYVPSAVGIHRYEYATENLTYQDYVFPQYDFERVEFCSDGSYALITGGEHIYRYEHNGTGFGAVTELTDIENPGSCTITFFDVIRHPVSVTEPLYILANIECGSSNRVKIFRYDPDHNPQIYLDESGGIGPEDSSNFEPWTGAWQADGDYLVWGNRTANGWHGRIFVWDPDHSTFPPNIVTDEMQDFAGGGLTNISTICMSPVSGSRFAMVKGMGRVVRFTEYPTTMTADFPSEYHKATSEGDSGFNAAGTHCLFLERQEWSPCHSIMVYDSVGDAITISQSLCGPNFTNQTNVRIKALEWHPTEQMGLMAGSKRWIFKFTDDPVPTATPTSIPVTPTPTSPPLQTVPSTGNSGIILLLIVFGSFLIIFRKQRCSID